MIKSENAAKTINENISIHMLTVGRFDSVSANGLNSLALLDMGWTALWLLWENKKQTAVPFGL